MTDALGPTGTVLTGKTYIYNRIGEVGLDRLRTTWVYDRLYQLTDDHRMAAEGRYRASFEYDLAGNRTFNGRLSIPNVTFAYDAGERLNRSRDRLQRERDAREIAEHKARFALIVLQIAIRCL
ncbi:MAG TPA: hypothetical protein VGE52_20340 [Pirellulales bacterium]